MWSIQPTATSTLATRPQFIVVNTEFMHRYAPGSPRRTWLEWLTSDSPYAEILRVKSDFRGSAFMWTRTMTDVEEDPYSNLDKINPEIAIYQLK